MKNEMAVIGTLAGCVKKVVRFNDVLNTLHYFRRYCIVFYCIVLYCIAVFFGKLFNGTSKYSFKL